MKKSDPVKQHVLPKFYLKNFSKEDQIYVYDKSNGISRRANIKSVFQKNYFTYLNKDGSKNYSIEKWLAGIESKAALALQRYLKNGKEINYDDKRVISLFVATTYLRMPDTRDFYAEILRDDLHEQLYNTANNNDFPPDLEEGVRKDLIDLLSKKGLGDFTCDIPQGETLEIFEYTQEIADLIFAMEWKLINAPEGEFFITGDTPLIRTSLDFRDPQVRLGMPFSSSSYWVASWKQLNKLPASRNMLEELNKYTIIHAKREIYCNQESKKIESLIKGNKISFERIRVNDPVPTKKPLINLVRYKERKAAIDG